MVEIVAFAGALADAGENGVTAVALGDVVDEFHDDDGLADARAAERADLAALGEGADQVDDLDAGLEDLRPVSWSTSVGAGRWIGYRLVNGDRGPRRAPFVGRTRPGR
jgi:hypothetical protein